MRISAPRNRSTYSFLLISSQDGSPRNTAKTWIAGWYSLGLGHVLINPRCPLISQERRGSGHCVRSEKGQIQSHAAQQIAPDDQPVDAASTVYSGNPAFLSPSPLPPAAPRSCTWRLPHLAADELTKQIEHLWCKRRRRPPRDTARARHCRIRTPRRDSARCESHWMRVPVTG